MAKKRYGNELHPCYRRWQDTVQRCENPNHPSYKNYGGKGISIDASIRSWKDWIAYIESLPNYDPKLSLDRIDGSKGYEKGNLRWVDTSTQLANIQDHNKGFNRYTGVNYSKTHNRWIARLTFRGKTLLSKVCLTEEDALAVRNDFIITNNLPHPIQKYVN